MSKLTKLYLSILLIFVFLTFQGCSLTQTGLSPEAKDFTTAGMNITLTEDFTEQDSITETAAYVSTDEMVAITKNCLEDLVTYGVSPKLSAKEYADLTIKQNDIASFSTEEDGLVSFSYDKTISGKCYRYFATAYKTAEAYWLVSFASEAGDYYQHLDNFKEYAKSITFE